MLPMLNTETAENSPGRQFVGERCHEPCKSTEVLMIRRPRMTKLKQTASMTNGADEYIRIGKPCIKTRTCLRWVLFVMASLGLIWCWQSYVPFVASAQNCPATPVVTITSPLAPTDVCIPDGFGGNPIQYFDDYSWRTFISMVWPAAGQLTTAGGHKGLML